jgi:hypothetical protein
LADELVEAYTPTLGTVVPNGLHFAMSSHAARAVPLVSVMDIVSKVFEIRFMDSLLGGGNAR